ncbi:MAG: hypothetical protein AAGG75_02300 [Bacteroidota bacterium]
MRFLQYTLIFTLLIGWGWPAEAHVGPGSKSYKKASDADKIRYRMDCAEGRSQTDLAINNVRARLLIGGDLWWDGEQNGRYVIPKIDPSSGQLEVSSIFAGAVWLGGRDPGNNLKVACQTYGAGGRRDFWPGPLSDIGTIEADECANWDKFFKVTGANIDQHLRNYNAALTAGVPYDPDEIPLDVKGWPARGNPHFFEIHGFELPDPIANYAPFFEPGVADGNYDPEQGDYPIIQIRGCDAPQYPDEIIFWIYNDAGNVHTETMGKAIRMEVQVQAFGYATNDEINDMSFVRYKLINRAVETIRETFFAMWVDPDLGCYTDDYIGCDTSRSLAYVYNMDALDGETSCDDCEDGVATYCTEIPILGVDYFRGPLDSTGTEIGMSSFTYYNNRRLNPPPGTDDPNAVPQEYYNYLSGRWRDGTPFTTGGNGYNLGSNQVIRYAFPDPPNDLDGWSMCSESLPQGDRRTIQASGPFTLQPGATNELIIGVPWVPNIADYPCPDIRPLLNADDIAQALFDNCFEITDGPDAPDVDWIELDKQLVAVLTNDQFSNNFEENYSEVDLRAPTLLPTEERQYRFEGYKLFQLQEPNVSRSELDDPDKARLIYQVDLANGVSEIYNWKAIVNPNAGPGDPGEIWLPELQVEGADEGIRHTFVITEDQFATGDRRLVNHRKYYFTALAYAYNNYADFQQIGDQLSGQRTPYLEGRRNIRNYTAIPRPIVDQTLNAEYGDGVVITRLDGEGTGANYLAVSDETREAMFAGTTEGEITYLPGAGPVDVKVYNPLAVVDGEYELSFYDDNLNNDELETPTNWQLTKVGTNEVIESETGIETLNEQIIAQYGLSIGIKQEGEPGTFADPANGAIGAGLRYDDPNAPWYVVAPEGGPSDQDGALNFIKTGQNEIDNRLDPDQQLSSIGSGIFVPYSLCDYNVSQSMNPYISPAWMSIFSGLARNQNPLSSLNNVDVVLTSDKSKWSRCVVVETASPYHYSSNVGLEYETEGGVPSFGLRAAPSVSKDDNNGDGLPDPDGDGIGMGWFPGYAVDVETGERLNIFFGENSTYDGSRFPGAFFEKPTGRDMMWNPVSQTFLNTGENTIYNFMLGGQHFIYVTKQPYDECAEIRTILSGNSSRWNNVTRQISWTSFPLLRAGQQLNSYADGLIPNDLVIEMRVKNSYKVKEGTGVREGYPTYLFSIEGKEPTELQTSIEIDQALKAINVVPNPYYGYSGYEVSPNGRVVKITNLPAECVVTIYSLDGKFIRQYKRNEVGELQADRSNPGIEVTQYTPAIEWDLENNKGIPVASGVYLIHINAPGLGERVIKWFGVNRQLDTSSF